MVSDHTGTCVPTTHGAGGLTLRVTKTTHVTYDSPNLRHGLPHMVVTVVTVFTAKNRQYTWYQATYQAIYLGTLPALVVPSQQ